jgi:hypothetical protein
MRKRALGIALRAAEKLVCRGEALAAWQLQRRRLSGLDFEALLAANRYGGDSKTQPEASLDAILNQHRYVHAEFVDIVRLCLTESQIWWSAAPGSSKGGRNSTRISLRYRCGTSFLRKRTALFPGKNDLLYPSLAGLK